MTTLPVQKQAGEAIKDKVKAKAQKWVFKMN